MSIEPAEQLDVSRSAGGRWGRGEVVEHEYATHQETVRTTRWPSLNSTSSSALDACQATEIRPCSNASVWSSAVYSMGLVESDQVIGELAGVSTSTLVVGWVEPYVLLQLPGVASSTES